MANILALHNYSGAKWWRLEQIAKYINQYSGGKHQMMVREPMITPDMDQILSNTNVLILQAVGDPRIQEMAEEMRARQGTKLIYELDDLYDETTPKTNPSYEKTLAIQKNIENTIKVSDAMTVTNDKLKDFYSKFCKNVFTLPNYMDFEGYFDVPERHNETDEIRLGWAGGLSHKDDLETIVPAIKQVMEKYPQVRFIYCGYGGMSDPDAPEIQAIYGEDLFKDIPRERRELVSGVPVEYWPKRLNSLDFDIALAPLVSGGERGNWNECKTPIKWMEYASMRVPCVASKIKYGEVIDHGRTGFLCETTEDWVKYISMLIEDKELRRTIGKNAYADVKANHNLKDHWQEWVAVYEGVIDGKYKYEGPRTQYAEPITAPNTFELDFGLDKITDERRRDIVSEGIRILRG